ncbi:hypothetical protein AGLY_006604 [Aphis glycines]|uniref:Uncharacterized protein n=1 Tax=Aphis glycines TaxID=307491 RepID=A0A6G0TTV2_APHGL|nr:hypothetical protein AGLY_006604 [Aphis glycines]
MYILKDTFVLYNIKNIMKDTRLINENATLDWTLNGKNGDAITSSSVGLEWTAKLLKKKKILYIIQYTIGLLNGDRSVKGSTGSCLFQAAPELQLTAELFTDFLKTSTILLLDGTYFTKRIKLNKKDPLFHSESNAIILHSNRIPTLSNFVTYSNKICLKTKKRSNLKPQKFNFAEFEIKFCIFLFNNNYL